MEYNSGGLIASQLTDAPNATDWFLGGLVPYSAQALKAYGVDAATIDQYGPASLETARAKLTAALDVDAERVLGELVRIGFADMRRIFDAEGNLLHPRFMDDDTAAAIAEVEVSKKAGGEKPAVRAQRKPRAKTAAASSETSGESSDAADGDKPAPPSSAATETTADEQK